MIKRGQEVEVSAGAGQGFLITMRAEALQEGTLGEQIRLKNSESGRSLTAVVTGQNTARLR
jgi:flagella basal body P-ring formation protein FlgA